MSKKIKKDKELIFDEVNVVQGAQTAFLSGEESEIQEAEGLTGAQQFLIFVNRIARIIPGIKQVIALCNYKTIENMKNLLILIMCLSIELVGFAQVLTDIDEVSQLNENLIAVRNDEEWGFINEEGLLIIDYRDDFVLDKAKSYPFFKDGRCLIRKLIDNEYLYGFIDNSGNEVIVPQYLNASNFNNGYAIIIKLLKEKIGYNEVLKKDITTSKLEEFIIDINGEVVKYLENPRNYIPSRVKSKSPLNFHSKFIVPHLIAVMKKDGKWDIYEF